MFEEILKNMLEKIPDTIDKREGSVIYNALAPAALEMARLYVELETVLNEAFADTATREYLVRRAMERGITPFEATYAEGIGEFSGEVPIGSRFMIDDESFTVTEKLSETEYKLIADKKGSSANKVSGSLVPVEYIDSLESATLVKITVPGTDEEETEDFRKRYVESLKNASFGGNQADYKEKVRAIEGVSKVLVKPHYRGAGTVGLVITSADGEATEELVSCVQNIVDPQSSGEGLGLAPIGHHVTVESAKKKTIDVTLSLTFQKDYTFDNLSDKINDTIDEYFKEIAELWPENGNAIIRVSQIEKRLLDTEGILDVTYTALNGSEGNVQLSEDEIPVRGEVNAN